MRILEIWVTKDKCKDFLMIFRIEDTHQLMKGREHTLICLYKITVFEETPGKKRHGSALPAGPSCARSDACPALPWQPVLMAVPSPPFSDPSARSASAPKVLGTERRRPARVLAFLLEEPPLEVGSALAATTLQPESHSSGRSPASAALGQGPRGAPPPLGSPTHTHTHASAHARGHSQPPTRRMPCHRPPSYLAAARWLPRLRAQWGLSPAVNLARRAPGPPRELSNARSLRSVSASLRAHLQAGPRAAVSAALSRAGLLPPRATEGLWGPTRWVGVSGGSCAPAPTASRWTHAVRRDRSLPDALGGAPCCPLCSGSPQPTARRTRSFEGTGPACVGMCVPSVVASLFPFRHCVVADGRPRLQYTTSRTLSQVTTFPEGRRATSKDSPSRPVCFVRKPSPFPLRA